MFCSLATFERFQCSSPFACVASFLWHSSHFSLFVWIVQAKKPFSFSSRFVLSSQSSAIATIEVDKRRRREPLLLSQNQCSFHFFHCVSGATPFFEVEKMNMIPNESEKIHKLLDLFWLNEKYERESEQKNHELLKEMRTKVSSAWLPLVRNYLSSITHSHKHNNHLSEMTITAVCALFDNIEFICWPLCCQFEGEKRKRTRQRNGDR